MKRFVLPSVVAAIAFCIGMVLGRYALPGTKNSSVTKPSVVASAAVVSPVPLARAPAVAAAEPDHDSEQLSAGASAQAIIAKIKTALLHTGRQRIYTDLNKLSDSIDKHNARAILAFVETLRDNEKSMVLPIVISRWAELDPQAAVAYAQNLPVGSFRNWALTSAISGWAEHDTAAAMAWVDQMPPGQQREQAMQTIVSALADKDPKAALTFLENLPPSRRRQNLYWPIFSRWTMTDPLASE